jgi:hypothetical protein
MSAFLIPRLDVEAPAAVECGGDGGGSGGKERDGRGGELVAEDEGEAVAVGELGELGEVAGGDIGVGQGGEDDIGEMAAGSPIIEPILKPEGQGFGAAAGEENHLGIYGIGGGLLGERGEFEQVDAPRADVPLDVNAGDGMMEGGVGLGGGEEVVVEDEGFHEVGGIKSEMRRSSKRLERMEDL